MIAVKLEQLYASALDKPVFSSGAGVARSLPPGSAWRKSRSSCADVRLGAFVASAAITPLPVTPDFAIN
jgi:hypothetical protein